MTKPRTLIAIALVSIATLPLASPAMAQRWEPGRWDWAGGRDDDRQPYELVGPGVRMLLPELRETRRGRAFVLRNFDRRHDGFIGPREAQAANDAFLGAIGPDRTRFSWTIVDRGPIAGPPGRHHWDRAAMRSYGFRDTREGARLTLQEDVLFRTDSADLRPGAIDKLQALADYLNDNPGVRVAIDGFTDSRGSDAHNQALSDRRAASVRAAFAQMGVTSARFRVRGHGEADPVAPNTSPENMRRNRRVEITLLGQRASAFG
ncbi:OmpA family protein [Sphingomonas sp. MMS24-J13]|uniref:OmpA family protein n=1 Tax=Sphingomonas sp. MMS24-J13 TaxID=3238686 RepID=UPI00384FD27F